MGCSAIAGLEKQEPHGRACYWPRDDRVPRPRPRPRVASQFCPVTVSNYEIISPSHHPTASLSRCLYNSSPTSAHSERAIRVSIICQSQNYLPNRNGVACRVKSPCGSHLSWAYRPRIRLNDDWGVRMSSSRSIHDILTCSDRYEFYSSFAIWPEEVRSDLRAGVKAKQQGNLALSRKLLTQCVLPYLCAYAVTETRVKSSPDRFIPPA